MKVKKTVTWPVIIGVLFFVSAIMATAYYLGAKEALDKTLVTVDVATPSATATPKRTATPTVTATVTPTIAKVKIPKGWETYKNALYGFEISFPKSFKALDSANDLYGYPNGVALIYGGSQAYDVVIEVWNTEAQYKQKYANQLSQVTVFKLSTGKFLTLFNNTQEAVNQQIIGTFTLL